MTSNKSTKLRLPKQLQNSATIGICAPSGSVDKESLEHAVSYFESKGHKVVLSPQASYQWRYFAGNDEERLSAFHELLNDPSIDILMAARGGYGWSRILHKVDFAAVKKTKKIIVGFSDFTSFNLAALAQSNLVTFAGPMAAVDFGNGNVSEFMENNFWSLLYNSTHSIHVENEHDYEPQVIEGQLWGSNLSLVSHLVGTDYLPAVKDGILFLEEVAEEPYAVERMLFQLYHAGILQKQKAIVLGDFSCCKPTLKNRYPYEMHEVIESLKTLIKVPILTDLPFGHIKEKMSLPIGGHAALHLTKEGFTVRFSEYNQKA